MLAWIYVDETTVPIRSVFEADGSQDSRNIGWRCRCHRDRRAA
jgi:hypothetical protein